MNYDAIIAAAVYEHTRTIKGTATITSSSQASPQKTTSALPYTSRAKYIRLMAP